MHIFNCTKITNWGLRGGEKSPQFYIQPWAKRWSLGVWENTSGLARVENNTLWHDASVAETGHKPPLRGHGRHKRPCWGSPLWGFPSPDGLKKNPRVEVTWQKERLLSQVPGFGWLPTNALLENETQDNTLPVLNNECTKGVKACV